MGLVYENGKFYYDNSNNVLFNFVNNPNVRLIFTVVVIYIFLFSVINSYSNPDTPPRTKMFITIVEILLWIGFVYIIIINYEKSTDITKDILKFYDIKKYEAPPPPEQKDEVFHIPTNKYNYKEARDVCSSFGGRLATYQEVENAYNNGGNWCSYGWSADQMALFPIQNSVYNELKNIPGHEHDCGRPGVNGGYMKDNTLKFGVNCYGKKPVQSELDKKYMDSYSFSPYYDDKKIEKEKQQKIKDVLVAPFNKEKWNA
jgi:hypothetical protein